MYRILTIIFLLFIQSLQAQVKMEVIRTSAVDRSTPVTNVFVDAENNKWVGNRKGLFKVFSPEQAAPVELQPSEWSLLQTHDGNFDLRYPMETLIAMMGPEGQSIKNRKDRITTATYHETKDILWIGTFRSGLFQFKTKPSLQLVKRHHTGNSKLDDNQVNTLLLDTRGKLWIGTYSGAVVVDDGKWDVNEKGFSFQAFAQNGADVWAMADNLLWKINARNDWDPKDIDASLTEGDVADIAFDQDGLLWVVSQIVARYDPATDEATVFGPAIGFTSQDVYCIAVDQNNGVWIGSNDKGLYLIQKASTLYVALEVEKNLNCDANAKDASLKVTVSGGEEPYNFDWNNGLQGNNPKNLGPGEYTVTVTDSRGKRNTGALTINDPSLKLELKQGKQASPEGTADGSATVNVRGGQPAYTYRWDNGETKATAFQLAEGPHTVTVTDKAGCSATGTINIGKEIGALNIAINQTENIRCGGDKTAGLKVEVSGGKAPYQFQWNASSLSGEAGNSLPAGNYLVTVSDASGQSASTSITVEEPRAIAVKVKVNQPASTGNSDGKATAEVTGGTAPYSFNWDTGEKVNAANKLAPGEHTVTVTDANGCNTTGTVSITENILPLAVNLSQTKDILCAGDKGAALQASVEGGKGPFQYAWKGTSSKGDAADGLGAGNYTVTLTDATGATVTADFAIEEPKAIEVRANAKSPASTGNADGKATAKASGGTGKIIYAWDNGEKGDVAEKLAPGEHTVTATDESGCTATATVSITEDILPLAIDLSQTAEIACAGGSEASLQAEVSGGKGPFTYQWSNGISQTAGVSDLKAGSYALTVTDATGQTATADLSVDEPKPVSLTVTVNASASTGNSDGKATAKADGGRGDFTYKWDNGETGKTAEKLAPVEHSVTVTDGAGCSATAVVAITENILPLSVSVEQVEAIKCAGEKTAVVEAEVNGGKGPFTFAWSGTSADGSSPSVTDPDKNATKATARSIGAGNYSLVVTDVTETSFTSAFSISEPKPLTATATVNASASTGNADGKATAKATGGTGKLSYSWDTGENTKTAEKLAPGEHTVTITDEAGCTATANVTITENILPLAVNLTQNETIKCAGESTAAIEVEVSGGKGPFSYKWDQPGVQGAAPAGLAPGNYTLTVTDATGQTKDATIRITEPAPLSATLIRSRPTTTFETTNGKASVRASGGTGLYTYDWGNGETAESANALSAGEHIMTVTDANGCKETVTFETKVRITPELSAENFRNGDVINIKNIYFQPDSTSMDPESVPSVDELFEFLEDNPGIVVEVGGHTNGIPPHEFCDKLSTERAKSVALYLVDKGISAEQLRYKGYGKRKPIATNATPEGRAKNQRVEIKILEINNEN